MKSEVHVLRSGEEPKGNKHGMREPPMFSIDVRDFAIVTYTVPVERVEPHLPTPYELNTYDGASVLVHSSRRQAFVTRISVWPV